MLLLDVSVVKREKFLFFSLIDTGSWQERIQKQHKVNWKAFISSCRIYGPNCITAVNRKGLTHVHIALYKPVCKFTQWFIQRYVHIALYKPLCKFTQWFIQRYMHIALYKPLCKFTHWFIQRYMYMGQPFPVNGSYTIRTVYSAWRNKCFPIYFVLLLYSFLSWTSVD